MIGVSVPKQDRGSIADTRQAEMMVTTDYLSAGNVIGEWGMLTGIARNSSCTCETSVQVKKKATYLIFNKNCVDDVL